VLPIAVGLATRTVEYLSGASKAYVAEVTFGVSTDSSDIDGTVTRIEDTSHLTEEAVGRAVAGFRGPQMQVPPMHSAIKIGGEKMYDLARRGEVVELEPRPITIPDIVGRPGCRSLCPLFQGYIYPITCARSWRSTGNRCIYV
jgi:tRNA pseudouridine55 synthase